MYMIQIAVIMISGLMEPTRSSSMALKNKPITSNVLLPFLDYRSILVADAKLTGEVTPYA